MGRRKEKIATHSTAPHEMELNSTFEWQLLFQTVHHSIVRNEHFMHVLPFHTKKLGWLEAIEQKDLFSVWLKAEERTAKYIFCQN